MKKLKTPPPAFAPPDYDAADVTAIQQLEQGTANAEMQKRALDWIIRQACRTYDVSYRPGDTHETAFHEGRRFVGNEVIKMLKLDPSKLRRNENG